MWRANQGQSGGPRTVRTHRTHYSSQDPQTRHGTVQERALAHPHRSTALASCSKWAINAIKHDKLTHMTEHDPRGAKARPRGKLGHAVHGTRARGPNADVMFVCVWSPYISLGLVIPAGHPPLLPRASAFTYSLPSTTLSVSIGTQTRDFTG